MANRQLSRPKSEVCPVPELVAPLPKEEPPPADAHGDLVQPEVLGLDHPVHSEREHAEESRRADRGHAEDYSLTERIVREYWESRAALSRPRGDTTSAPELQTDASSAPSVLRESREARANLRSLCERNSVIACQATPEKQQYLARERDWRRQCEMNARTAQQAPREERRDVSERSDGDGGGPDGAEHLGVAEPRRYPRENVALSDRGVNSHHRATNHYEGAPTEGHRNIQRGAFSAEALANSQEIAPVASQWAHLLPLERRRRYEQISRMSKHPAIGYLLSLVTRNHYVQTPAAPLHDSRRGTALPVPTGRQYQHSSDVGQQVANVALAIPLGTRYVQGPSVIEHTTRVGQHVVTVGTGCCCGRNAVVHPTGAPSFLPLGTRQECYKQNSAMEQHSEGRSAFVPARRTCYCGDAPVVVQRTANAEQLPAVESRRDCNANVVNGVVNGQLVLSLGAGRNHGERGPEVEQGLQGGRQIYLGTAGRHVRNPTVIQDAGSRHRLFSGDSRERNPVTALQDARRDGLVTLEPGGACLLELDSRNSVAEQRPAGGGQVLPLGPEQNAATPHPDTRARHGLFLGSGGSYEQNPSLVQHESRTGRLLAVDSLDICEQSSTTVQDARAVRLLSLHSGEHSEQNSSLLQQFTRNDHLQSLGAGRNSDRTTTSVKQNMGLFPGRTGAVAQDCDVEIPHSRLRQESSYIQNPSHDEDIWIPIQSLKPTGGYEQDTVLSPANAQSRKILTLEKNGTGEYIPPTTRQVERTSVVQPMHNVGHCKRNSTVVAQYSRETSLQLLEETGHCEQNVTIGQEYSDKSGDSEESQTIAQGARKESSRALNTTMSEQDTPGSSVHYLGKMRHRWKNTQDIGELLENSERSENAPTSAQSASKSGLCQQLTSMVQLESDVQILNKYRNIEQNIAIVPQGARSESVEFLDEEESPIMTRGATTEGSIQFNDKRGNMKGKESDGTSNNALVRVRINRDPLGFSSVIHKTEIIEIDISSDEAEVENSPSSLSKRVVVPPDAGESQCIADGVNYSITDTESPIVVSLTEEEDSEWNAVDKGVDYIIDELSANIPDVEDVRICGTRPPVVDGEESIVETIDLGSDSEKEDGHNDKGLSTEENREDRGAASMSSVTDSAKCPTGGDSVLTGDGVPASRGHRTDAYILVRGNRRGSEEDDRPLTGESEDGSEESGRAPRPEHSRVTYTDNGRRVRKVYDLGERLSNELTLRTKRSVAQKGSYVESEKSEWRPKTKEFECKVCKMTFPSRQLLKKHRRPSQDGGKKRFECSACGRRYRFMRNLEKHLDAHTGSRYMCGDCGKEFPHRYNLLCHREEHTGERHYRCIGCGDDFASNDELVRHRTRSGERPYRCCACASTFPWRSLLRVHVAQLHERPARYRCGVCARAFRWSAQLMMHLQAAEPCRLAARCAQCGRGNAGSHGRFRCGVCKEHRCSMRGMKQHKLDAHPDTQCMACGRHCISTVSLQRHVLRRHHKTALFKCKTCEGVVGKEELRRHMHGAANQDFIVLKKTKKTVTRTTTFTYADKL